MEVGDNLLFLLRLMPAVSPHTAETVGIGIGFNLDGFINVDIIGFTIVADGMDGGNDEKGEAFFGIELEVCLSFFFRCRNPRNFLLP